MNDVKVQACRPEDRALLATDAGKQLVQAAVSALQNELSFVEKLRGSAHFLRANYQELHKSEAEVLVGKLFAAAREIERLEALISKAPNVELTGSGQVHRPESSEQRERG